MSQNDLILRHLQAGRQIDPWMALNKYSCFRLAARIKDLRDMGHKILSVKKTVFNKAGEPCHIAIYKLIKGK